MFREVLHGVVMRHPSAAGVRSASAAILVLWLGSGLGSVVPALAQEDRGLIRGFLYAEDEVTTIGGGKVTAIDIRTGRRYESNMTGENGAYEITRLPAGTYDIVMEAGGTFITNSLVDLAEGQRLTLSLARQPGQAPVRKVPGLEKPRGTAVPTTASPSAAAPPPGSRPYWKTTPGILLLSVLGGGAALTIANAVGDDDENASASAP